MKENEPKPSERSPQTPSALTPDEFEIFRLMVANFRDFHYADAVHELGAKAVEAILADGYVVVPWEEHADMFRLRSPNAVRDLDPIGILDNVPIWNVHAFPDELGPLVASPKAESLRAAREYARAHPVESRNGQADKSCRQQLPPEHKAPENGCGKHQPNL